MTIDISNNNPRVSYSVAESVSQTVFSVPFDFFETSDVSVYVDDALKTIGSDYTIAGGDGSTGTITFVSPVIGASGGSTVVVARHVSLERVTDFVAGQDINRAALNTQLDTIVAQISDLDDKVDRTIHLSDSEVAPSMLLTDDRKGRVLAFDSVTGDVEAGPLSNDIQTIADNITEILDVNNQAAAAAASEAAAANSATAAQTAETAAELAETNAETAETNAAASAVTAASEAATATTKASEASTSATNAATSESNAASSATASASSASASATSETNAATSETNAATSETNAATSETNAATSATASAGSATAAATSETNAATSESNAAASEAAASTSESNAAASATSASSSAATATTKASEAATSASNAATSASSAQASKDAALAALDSFDDRYLGQKAADPTVDNDGDALVSGALYFNTTDDIMKVYDGSLWVAAYASLSGAMFGANNLSDVADAAGSRTNLGLGTGDSPTFAGLTTTGDVSFGDNDKAIFGAGSDLQIYHSGTDSVLKENGTGDIIVAGNNLGLRTGDLNEFYLRAIANGEVGLYYDNAIKLATTSTGVDVTGTITSDGLTVSNGTVTFGGEGVSSAYINTPESMYFNVDSNNTPETSFFEFAVGRTGGSGGKKRLTIGSDGDISFYEDTGTTPKFFWDASAESLGIGTGSPSYNLHLEDSSASLAVISGTSGNSTILLGDTTDNNKGRIIYTQSIDTMKLLTNGSEAMRIDSSGNLLVGTTSSSSNTAGIKLTAAGTATFVRSGVQPVYINRLTSDGDLAVFAKDGSTVGSIGNNGNEIFIGSPNSGGTYLRLGGGGFYPATSTGANSDNTTNIGDPAVRFKDLYLSGGVYLGGTGAANKLDDYEEGTWTPSVIGTSSTGTTTYNANGQKGGYTKIGNLVTLTFYASWSAMTGTGSLRIIGMPFALSGNTSNDVSAGNCMTSDLDIPNNTNNLTLVGTDGDTYLRIFSSIDAGGIQQIQCDAGGAIVWGQLTYRTNS